MIRILGYGPIVGIIDSGCMVAIMVLIQFAHIHGIQDGDTRF